MDADFFPNNWKGYLRVSALAASGITLGLLPRPWDSWFIAAIVFAGLTLLVVRRINRRDSKRPPDFP